jgi:cytochrome c biogenesis protein ResB
VVEVNQSFSFAGWKFHQSSYRPINDADRYELAVRAPDSPTTQTVEISPGQRRAVPGLPGVEMVLSETSPIKWTAYRQGTPVASGSLAPALSGKWTLEALQFEPDFVIDGKKATSRSQNPNNPALKVAFYQGGQMMDSQWLFADAKMQEMMRSMTHNRPRPFEVELVNLAGQAPDWRCELAVRAASGASLGKYQVTVGQQVSLGGDAEAPDTKAANGWAVSIGKRVQAYATYLTLTRNPMIPLIYGGCVIMMLGTLAVFFIRFRQVWVRVDEAAHRLDAAAVYRNPLNGLDRATRAALARLAGAAGPLPAASAPEAVAASPRAEPDGKDRS